MMMTKICPAQSSAANPAIMGMLHKKRRIKFFQDLGVMAKGFGVAFRFSNTSSSDMVFSLVADLRRGTEETSSQGGDSPVLIKFIQIKIYLLELVDY